MKPTIQIETPCKKCGAKQIIVYFSGDAADKIIHCGTCDEWQTVSFRRGETEDDAKPAAKRRTRKPAR